MSVSFKDKVKRKINSYIDPTPNDSSINAKEEISAVDQHSIYIEIKDDLASINVLWDSICQIKFTSNRKKHSGYIIKVKRVLHRLISWYIDQIVVGQTDFNASATRIMNKLVSYIDRLSVNQVELEKKCGIQFEELKLNISDLKWIIENQRIEIDELKSINSTKEFNAIESYLDFENEFRGPEELIEKRLNIYTEYIQENKKAIDIGCGRGELLTLLNKSRVDAIGIDINAEMISYCQNKGYDAICIDGVEYLNSIENDSLDYIFMIQVVEHLNANYLRDIIEMAYKKLTKGGVIFMETPNSQNLYIYANSFYVDPTHTKPISAHYLRYLSKKAGFTDVSFRYMSPVESNRMLVEDEKFGEYMNENISKLNKLIFGQQDCIVISRK